jgi:hypothetical protein
MPKNITDLPFRWQQETVSEPAGRFAWLRSRRTIALGVALFGVILVVFIGGRFLTSQDQVAVAAAQNNSLLSARAYQFTGQGKILGGSGAAWIIGGVPVVVSDQTQLANGVHPGDAVSVLGQIGKDGKWLAKRIALITDQDSFFSFGGPVERRTGTAWQVAGISVHVDDQTQIATPIQDNELVVVTFKVQPDGTWLALNIESLSAVAGNPTPTILPPTSTPPAPDPTVSPPEPATSQNQIVSDQKSPPIKPAKKPDKGPSDCHKPHDKGKGKDHGKCS